jgi:hypothetical protein
MESAEHGHKATLCSARLGQHDQAAVSNSPSWHDVSAMTLRVEPSVKAYAFLLCLTASLASQTQRLYLPERLGQCPQRLCHAWYQLHEPALAPYPFAMFLVPASRLNNNIGSAS